MKCTIRAAAAIAAAAVFVASAGAAWGAGVTATLKGGFFAPSNEVFRDVYSGGLSFGFELAVPVGGIVQLWAGAGLFSKTGHLTLTEDETKGRIVPIHLGLRCEFGKKALRPYVGAAAAYFLFHEENVLGTLSEGGIGFLTQAGVMARIGGPVWLDLHAGFRGCKLKTGDADPVEARLDGFSGGLGIAARF